MAPTWPRTKFPTEFSESMETHIAESFINPFTDWINFPTVTKWDDIWFTWPTPWTYYTTVSSPITSSTGYTYTGTIARVGAKIVNADEPTYDRLWLSMILSGPCLMGVFLTSSIISHTIIKRLWGFLEVFLSVLCYAISMLTSLTMCFFKPSCYVLTLLYICKNTV
eukprot:sb/3472482/